MAPWSVGIRISLILAVTLVGVSKCCHSQLNCASNECCVTNYGPIGKRMLLIVQGHCQPMGREGSSCFTRYGSAATPPTGIVNACPCGVGQMCKGSGLQEVPLGEAGNCVHL